MTKGVLSSTGAMAFIVGLAGLGGACEGQGSFLIAAIVFSVGIGLSLMGYQK